MRCNKLIWHIWIPASSCESGGVLCKTERGYFLREGHKGEVSEEMKLPMPLFIHEPLDLKDPIVELSRGRSKSLSAVQTGSKEL